MIVEQRIYTLHPGKVPDQVIFLWGYESAHDRSARRDRLAQDPAWQAYLAKVMPLLVTQEGRLLRPTEFSPIR